MRYASLTLFVVFVLSLAYSSPAATTQPAPREMAIKLVRADDGKPLGDAECWYEIDGGEGTKIKVGASGEIKISLPAGAREMSVSVQKAGFVMMDVAFGARRRPWTDHLTLPLRQGVTIGGIVRDQDGKPVERVKVLFEAIDDRPDMPERRVFGGGIAYTDRDGKWSYAGAPQRPLSISIDAQHPDYTVNSSHRADAAEDFDLLKKKAFVTIIHRGLSVSGVIVDEQQPTVQSQYFHHDAAPQRRA